MTPSHTAKGPRRYRYYVSRAVLRDEPAGPVRRIAAHTVEAAVIAALRTADPRSFVHRSAEPLDDAALIDACLERVTVHADALRLDLRGADGSEPIRIPWAAKTRHRRRDIVVPPGADHAGLRPVKVEDRARILAAIARSRAWVADLIAARVSGTAAIALREGYTKRAVRMTLPLALLSPKIVRAIVDHRLPRGIVIRDLAALPASWAEQERAVGL